MKKTILAMFVVVLASVYGYSAGNFALDLPGKAWVLEIGMEGFELERYEMAPDLSAVNLQAYNKTTGMVMSAFLEKAEGVGGSKECRDFYWKKAQKSPMKKDSIKLSEIGNTALVEYIVKEYEGKKIDQYNLNAYLAKDDVWIDIHLSKVTFKSEDKKLFDTVVKALRINETYRTDASECAMKGSLFYSMKNYKPAIYYYEKCLGFEKKNRSIAKDEWLVVADNLGMAYGISGDLKGSKKAYENALTVYPQYPMFYYNLACTCAEMDDIESVLKNLKLTYKYKSNMIAGETLPDPTKDSSFKKYLKDEKFVKAVKEGGK